MDYTQKQCDGYKEDYEEFLSKYNNLKVYIQSLDPVLEEVLSYYEYYKAECKKAGVKIEINHEDLAGVTNRYQKLTESIRGDVTIFRLLIINPDWDYKYELRALDKVYRNLNDKYEMFLKYNKISEGE